MGGGVEEGIAAVEVIAITAGGDWEGVLAPCASARLQTLDTARADWAKKSPELPVGTWRQPELGPPVEGKPTGIVCARKGSPCPICHEQLPFCSGGES